MIIRGPEDRKRRQSKVNKRLVVVALEKVKNGADRACAPMKESAFADKFKQFFVDYIDPNAEVVTDELRSYLPLKVSNPNQKQAPLKEGENFSGLHFPTS